MSQLSALDLLDMPDDEQAVVRCLTRRPGLTAGEIAHDTALPPADLAALLGRMVRAARLVERLQGGQRVFAIRFARPARRARNLTPAIAALLEVRPRALLASAPLSAALDDAALDALLARGVGRQALADEVIVWQGQPCDCVGLLCSGLLKTTRLSGAGRAAHTGYLRPTEWFGITELLGGYPSADTCAALLDSELLLWGADDFADFLARHAGLGLAIGRWLSRRLQRQREQPGQLWAVEGLHAGAGASTLAAGLAALAAAEGHADPGAPPAVLLWRADGEAVGPAAIPGVAEEQLGLDEDYPPQVQLDISLADAQQRYQHIICDTGAAVGPELAEQLRARAQSLLSVTADPAGAEAIQARWAGRRAGARPDQRRVAVLNRAPAGADGLAFQVVLPEAGRPAPAARDTPLGQALVELYRRLSLNHTIGIFIPSTVDVDLPVDNSRQVQQALAFLGGLFGGATRNAGEGAWQSEASGLVVEQVTVVRSFVSRQALEQRLDAVIGFVAQLKQEMRQEAIAVDVDSQLVLV